MDINPVTPVGAEASGVVRRLPALLQALRTPRLEPMLFRAMRDDVQCEHMTVFSLPEAGTPRGIMAADAGPAGAARQVASRYLAGYWRLDPANAVHPSLQTEAVSVRIGPADLPLGDYRHDCYTSLRLVDRFSVMQRTAGGIVRMNLYRGRDAGRFGDREIARIISLAPIVTALLLHHDGSGFDVGTAPSAAALDERLRLAAPTLTGRERAVCVGIVRGQTSEAIALDLNIAINTVLTYRKRAYSRLCISSQNELMKLALLY